MSLERADRLRIEEEVAGHLEAASDHAGDREKWWSLAHNSTCAAICKVCGLDSDRWNWREELTDWQLCTLGDICRGLTATELARVMEAAIREGGWICMQCDFESEDGPIERRAHGPECPECEAEYAMVRAPQAVSFEQTIAMLDGVQNLVRVRREMDRAERGQQ